MATNNVQVARLGSILSDGDRQFCVKRMLSDVEAEVVDIQSGEISRRSIVDFDEVTRLDGLASRGDLAALDIDNWEVASKRFKAIQGLLGKSKRTREDVVEVSQQVGVNPATIYRWLKRFDSNETVSSLVRKERSDQGQSRVDDEIETMMNDVIRDVYLVAQAPSVTLAYRELARRCRSKGLTAPHISTFRRRTDSIAPIESARNREGKDATRRFKSIRGAFPGADYPYAVLQIDHTMVDIILVDENHRLPLQRPYITVAIDVYSRMVAGYYISFDPPGTLGTGLCISNAILSKERRLRELGLDFEWPCSGLPATIHLDNAKEFRGDTIKMACKEYCINLEFRPVKQPNYGGHIERLMGTLMNEIHVLPGTTRSGPEKLGDYKPAKEAAMTLQEFEAWFANLVIGAYHHRMHSELEMTPIEKFRQGVAGDSDNPGTGILPVSTDEEKLRIDFLPFEMRTIQTYGILLDGIYYQADVLSRWIGARESGRSRAKKKFVVRRDPRDISHVLFYDPNLKRHFRIPYQNTKFPAISLWELKAVQRYLAEQGRKSENQDVIFAAYDEMQKIVESSGKLTKGARKAEARRKQQAHSREKKPLTSKEPLAAVQDYGELIQLEDIKPFDNVEEL